MFTMDVKQQHNNKTDSHKKMVGKPRVVYIHPIVDNSYCMRFFNTYILVNPIALSTAKTSKNFGCSECNRVKIWCFCGCRSVEKKYKE